VRAFALAILLMCATMCVSLAADSQVAIPSLTARVTDQTGTFTSAQKAALEQTLQDFEAKKGSQIAVLIISSTAPETIEQYSMRVVEQWKLGRKRVDDGALLIVAKDDRALRIEVGYGLEGALNDAVCKRIITEIVTPRFQQGDFYGGISAGVNRMMSVIEGEPLPEPAQGTPASDRDLSHFVPVLFILTLIGGSILRVILGRFAGAIAAGGVTALVAWMFIGTIAVTILAGVLAFLFTLLDGGRYGVGSGRYGGFGGGGGFSGGGGGFGGGGASGRW